MKKIKNINFKLNDKIKPKPRTRVNYKYKTVYNPNTKYEKDLLEDILDLLTEEQLEFIKEIREDKNIYIEVKIQFNYETKRDIQIGLAKRSKADIDNLAKTILDSMNGIFYYDDRLIYSLKTSKWYDTTDNTLVSITYYR